MLSYTIALFSLLFWAWGLRGMDNCDVSHVVKCTRLLPSSCSGRLGMRPIGSHRVFEVINLCCKHYISAKFLFVVAINYDYCLIQYSWQGSSLPVSIKAQLWYGWDVNGSTNGHHNKSNSLLFCAQGYHVYQWIMDIQYVREKQRQLEVTPI